MKILRIFVSIILAGLMVRSSRAATATLTTVHSFNGNDGGAPVQPPTIGSDGNFYGTTFEFGADGWGTVYMMTPQGTLTTLYTFQGYDGIGPRGFLVETNGLFYGTTQQGGIYVQSITNLCCGTVFNITPQGTLTTIYNFTGDDGKTSDSGLVLGDAGLFYGTTYGGGTGAAYNGSNTDTQGDMPNNPPGTVYKITAQGTLTTLHSFSGTDGANPGKEAVVGLDGNLYGTTLFGGPSDYGTIYSVSSAGTFTSIYAFTNGLDGSFPKARLLQGMDGNFYGTTLDGGGKVGNKWCPEFGCGTVFKITTQGTLTVLHDFNGDPEPAHPGSLTAGPDGNFYGTSYTGGTNHEGTVYLITPQGAVTTLHQFVFTDGALPLGGLTLASDGSFYGTTSQGGDFGYGTIFRVVVNTNADAGCLFTLNATSVTLTAKGGLKSVSVKASRVDCPWAAVSNDPFITIVGAASGLGSGKVEFMVAGNTNTAPQMGTLTIAGQTFTVNQALGGCQYKLSPKAGKIKVTGGTAVVKVNPTLSDCVWTAVSNDPFITILTGTNGIGKGAVSYTVPTNSTSLVLTGSITVAGEPFTVIQAAAR